MLKHRWSKIFFFFFGKLRGIPHRFGNTSEEVSVWERFAQSWCLDFHSASFNEVHAVPQGAPADDELFFLKKLKVQHLQQRTPKEGVRVFEKGRVEDKAGTVAADNFLLGLQKKAQH